MMNLPANRKWNVGGRLCFNVHNRIQELSRSGHRKLCRPMLTSGNISETVQLRTTNRNSYTVCRISIGLLVTLSNLWRSLELFQIRYLYISNITTRLCMSVKRRHSASFKSK